MKCFIIIDYNNTRYTDVSRMRDSLFRLYGLKLILVRPEEAPHDRSICDVFLSYDLNDVDAAHKLVSTIRRAGHRPQGGFVFSDRSMPVGTELLFKLGLTSITGDLAERALCKHRYRMAEQQLFEDAPIGLFLPKFRAISSYVDLEHSAQELGYPLILKPKCEGNNRGVSRIDRSDQLRQAWLDVSPYLEGGVILEQLIPFAREFSFDGFGRLEFFTAKVVARGQFPVERGQQVPAVLTPEELKAIREAGRFANRIVGGAHSSFHNEIKIDQKSNSQIVRAAVVEPNRRPAGMQIWDLAERVYGINFYEELLRFCLGELSTQKLPAPRGIASIRMLPADRDGVWPLTRSQTLLLIEESIEAIPEVEFFNLAALKEPGVRVRSVPTQNGDFVGSLCAFSSSLDQIQIQAVLDQVEFRFIELLKRRGTLYEQVV